MAQCRFLLLLCCMLCCTAAISSAQGIPGRSNSAEAATAAQSVIRLRDRERLLKNLAGQPLNNAAFGLLEQVFAHPIDVAMGESDETVWTGQREFAVQLLRQASVETQRSWQVLNESAAAAALQRALQLRDPRELSVVAARYPMTREGLRAEFILLNWKLLQADFAAVTAGIERIRRRCTGTVLSAEASRLISVLQQKTELLSSPHEIPPVLSVSNRVAEPEWTWRETIWLGSLRHRIGASFLLDAWSELRGIRSHPVEIWEDCLVVRTPFRLAGINPETGLEQWSLIEEASGGDRDSEADAAGNGAAVRGGWEYATQLRRMLLDSSRRQIKCDGRDLWVLGGLDLFDPDLESASADEAFSRFRAPFPDQQRNQGASHRAATLVALRRQDGQQAPQIAWVAGDASGYTGGVQNGPIARRMTEDDFGRLHRNAAVANSDGTGPLEADPLAGHEFLCLPGIGEQRLFVLSECEDVCYLNCLNRGTGRVHWQQPVCVGGQTLRQNSGPWGSVSDPNELLPARCFVVRGSVICQLSSCIWISADQGTGELQWVHVPSGIPELSEETPLDPLGADRSLVNAAEFHSAVSDQNIICMSPATGDLQCLDRYTGQVTWTAEGQILWGYSQTVSRDRRVIRQSADRLVLSGDHHLRALDPSTGQQLWGIECADLPVPDAADDERCLISISGRDFLAIDLRTGNAKGWSRSAAASANVSSAALTLNDSFVFQTNGNEVIAFRRADVVAESTADVRIAAAALMLNGQLDEIRRLRRVTDPADEQLMQFLDDLIGEALLDVLGWQDETTADLRIPAEQDAIVQELLTLQLSDHLRARCQLLGITRHVPSLAAYGSRRDFSFTASTLVPVSRTWRVSAQCLPDTDLLPRWLTDAAPAVVELHAMASSAARYPQRISSADVHALCEHLRSRGLLFAEEVVWSARYNWQLKTDQDCSEARGQLNRLRGISNSDENDGGDGSFTDRTLLQAVVRYSFSGAGRSDSRNSDNGPPMNAAAEPPQWMELTNWSPLSRYRQQLPAWYQHRLIIRQDTDASILTRGDSAETVISRLGGEADWIDRVDTGSESGQRFLRPLTTCPRMKDVPGLLPVTDSQNVSMIGLAADGRLRTLWKRRIPQSSTMLAGPLTGSGMVWYSDRHLRCTDLLSGRDLWTRDVSLLQSAEQQIAVTDFPHLFGDEQVTVTFWSGSSAWSAWDTRTGELQRSGRIPLGFSTTPVVAGRFLVFADPEYRLHVLDPLAGRDVLAATEPVLIGPYQREDTAAVTDTGLIMVVSSEGQLITLHPESGEILNRAEIPLPPDEPCVALHLIPRENEFLLLLKTAADRQRQRTRMFGMFDAATPEMTGLLVVVDKSSGAIRWSRPVQDTVLPMLAGDACDVIVLFSKDDSEEPEPASGALESRFLSEQGADWFGDCPLSVMVLNSRSGAELLAEPVVLMSCQYRGEPLVFDAQKQELRFRTAAAELVMRPQQKQ